METQMKKTISLLLLLLFLTSCSNNLPTIKTIEKPKEIITAKPSPETKKIVVQKPQISESRQVEQGLRKADIMIIFKDSEKVRYKFNENKFYSLNNIDLSNLNSLIKLYPLRLVEPYDSVIGKSEEELETEEKANEKVTGVEYPNAASIYYFSTESINVKDFIDRLRKEAVVLNVNEKDG